MNTWEYLAGPELLRHRELVFGEVHEPPAPRYSHQAVVTRMTVLLDQHVREHRLGMVCVSPLDVVLDKAKALIVQPDVVFIAHDRLEIVRDQVWGAPDLVVEVASPGTRRYDQLIKTEWYQTYGVRECWLVDAVECSVTVVTFEGGTTTAGFVGTEHIVSHVLPQIAITPIDCFDSLPF